MLEHVSLSFLEVRSVNVILLFLGLGSLGSGLVKTYFAALVSSTPSIFTKEVLGFVLRLPRWNDKCLPFTYTANRISVPMIIHSKSARLLHRRVGMLTSVVVAGRHLDGIVGERREMGRGWSKMVCRRGCCSPSKIVVKLMCSSRNWIFVH